MTNKINSTDTDAIKVLMAKKSRYLSKAQAFAEIGLMETAQPLFLSAASYEERIAALLDTLGQELEAAVHRISAASCYDRAGNMSSAVNLYRAALAGPLQNKTRTDVLEMLKLSLEKLAQQAPLTAASASMPDALIPGTVA
ncbi:MAG: hypothetical protein R3A44_32555 [Caldilineaceae bacterium]